MSVIKVTAEELTTLSSNVKNGAEQIDGILKSLSGAVNGVVGGEWMGAASSQFNSLYTEWQSGANQLNQALTGISSLLATAATQYQSTEDSIRSSFGSAGV